MVDGYSPVSYTHLAFQSAVLHEDTAQSALDKIAPELDALLAGEAS